MTDSHGLRESAVPVRWDSDHRVILDDELQAFSKELIRGGKLDRIHFGPDYFNASINRVRGI